MGQLGIGIIGFGEFAQFCHHAWGQLSDVKVVAAADINKDRIPSDLKAYGDWKELLADDEVDIVTIGTPPSTHTSMAIAALEAGKHVFVEKPPAITRDDVEKLVQAAERAGKICVVDYMLRFNPVVQALKQVCDTLVMGKLQHVAVSNYAYDGKLPLEHWFWDKSKSGGILVEHAVHFLDIITCIWPARPVHVSAHGISRQPGMEDKVVEVVEYDDGLVSTHYHHFFRPWWLERQTFRFAFDLGEIDVEGWVPLTAKVRTVATESGQETLTNIFEFADVTTEGLNLAEIAGDITYVPGAPTEVTEVTAGGTNYPADRLVYVDYKVAKPKIQVYEDCVRSSMEALADGIRSGTLPTHAIQNTADSVRISAGGAEMIAEGRKDSL